MGRVFESPEVDSLVPEIDFESRIVYFPVRHHSPACAWHVAELIRSLRPAEILIEGPRDANHLIPLLIDEQAKMPLAIYTTYIARKSKQDRNPSRFAGYYPICDFSPELAAIRAGAEVGANVRFIDLTFAEKVVAQRSGDRQQKRSVGSPRAGSLQNEPWYSHSALLKAACVRTGARDADDLWDHLFEANFRRTPTSDFVRGVWAYCEMARRDHTQVDLTADGCLAREHAMAAAIAETSEKTIVVTGGFHTVALANTPPKRPKPLRLDADDANAILMRYSFDQLDRLNGYASGMPSPAFYQMQWENRSDAEVLVEIARDCREANLPVSTADAQAAVQHVRMLARMRGHATTSREDLLDGVRSLFVKGAMDSEGVPVLALARKRLAGNTVGEVPDAATQPPIVVDFRRQAKRFRLKVEKIDVTKTTLDLYRNENHRKISRLFHQLAFLEVPFARFVQGPDFVTGEELHRVREVWTYHWSPQTESSLIVSSVYGATLEEAAASRLVEQFSEAEEEGYGGSSEITTRLVLLACRMGLHQQSQFLFERLGNVIAHDGRFVSVVAALENLRLLELSQDPLEANELREVRPLVEAAIQRACYLMASLSATLESEENATIDALNTLTQNVAAMEHAGTLHAIVCETLMRLLQTHGDGAVFRGAAAGLLYSESRLSSTKLVDHCRGHWAALNRAGADFLRGIMRTARSALWQLPELVDCLNEQMQSWDGDQFLEQLPDLRLALTQLSPRETSRVADRVAQQLDVVSLDAATGTQLALTESEVLRCARLESWLVQRLREEKLLELGRSKDNKKLS